jgi:hypothetical protein
VLERDDAELVRLVGGHRDQLAHERAVTLLEDVQGQHQAGKEHRAQREDRQPIAHALSLVAH